MDRTTNSLLQRTRPDPIGPVYNRAPADRPAPGRLAVGGLFAVRVWRDGPAQGATDGSKTTQCNRTYTARSLAATAIDTGGVLLGEDLTPACKIPRADVGQMSCPPATGGGWIGLGYFDSTGAFSLWSANETWTTGPCTEE